MTERNCICLTCSTQFTPKNKKKPSKFCAMACYRVYQKTPAYTTDYNRPRRTDQVEPCANCGTEVVGIKTIKRDGTRADNKYCNRKCYNEHRTKIRNEVTGQCKHCDTDLSKAANGSNADSVYCSMDCRNKGVRPEPRPCINCKTVFDPIKYHRNDDRYSRDNGLKTCSEKCLREFYRTNEARKEKISAAFKGDKHPNWLGGVSHHKRSFRGVDWQDLRQQAMKRDGYKCCHCGINHDEQMEKYNRSFSVNHIVPFFQSVSTEKANKLSNLETLCDSCHTKADWDYRKNNPMQGLLNFGSH